MTKQQSRHNDYGFLTFRGTAYRPRRNQERALKEDVPDLLLGSASLSLKTKASDVVRSHERRRQKKKSWWRWLFPQNGRKNVERPQKSVVCRSSSDAAERRAVLPRTRRAQRCQSMITDDSVVITEDTSMLNSTSELFSPQSSEAQTSGTKPRMKPIESERRSTIFGASKSASVDCLESLRNKDMTSAHAAFSEQHPCQTITTSMKDVKENETSNYLLQAGESEHFLKHCHISTKPGKNKTKRSKSKGTSLFRTDTSTAKNYIDFHENQSSICQTTNNNAKIKRTRSLLSFKNIFGKKAHNPVSAIIDTKKMTFQDFSHAILNDEKDKVEVEDFLNVYERYPRKKSEPRKVLVHIQTREEIPVENGIPQWDTISYQYAPNYERKNPLRSANVTKEKMVVSSFIGNCVSKKRHTIHDVQSLSNHHLDERVYSHNRPTSPCQILNLDNEPKNREIIKNTNESNDQLTITETDFKNEVRGKNLHEKSASFCDDVLFGRSFILTGTATDEVPEVLAKNYPYLASSSPVRNMAQCLRLASHSGLTRKATSWSKKSLCDGEADEKCNEELNKYAIEPATNVVENRSKPDDFVVNSLNSDHSSPCNAPRRCFSDSDLSSFHLSPMKVNSKHLPGENEDTGRKILRSRRTRTDCMLRRMRARLLRLEKLSDQAINIGSGPEMAQIENPCKALINTLSVEASPKVKNLVSRQKSIIDISTLPSPSTSSRKFSRLIQSRIERRTGAEHTAQRPCGKSSSEEQKEQPAPSISVYEYLWPNEDHTSSLALPRINLEPNQVEGKNLRATSSLMPESTTCTQCPTRNELSNGVLPPSPTDNSKVAKKTSFCKWIKEENQSLPAKINVSEINFNEPSSPTAKCVSSAVTEQSIASSSVLSQSKPTLKNESGAITYCECMQDRGLLSKKVFATKVHCDDHLNGKESEPCRKPTEHSAEQHNETLQGDSQSNVQHSTEEERRTHATFFEARSCCPADVHQACENGQPRCSGETTSVTRSPALVVGAARLDPANCDDSEKCKALEKLFGMDDIFLSSTPVKGYSRHAAHANENFGLGDTVRIFREGQTEFTEREAHGSATTQNDSHYTNGSTEEANIQTSQTTNQVRVDERQPLRLPVSDENLFGEVSRSLSNDSLSPNPSVLPTASDFFLQSLLIHQNETKRTMMEEMRKISNKYDAVTSPRSENCIFPSVWAHRKFNPASSAVSEPTDLDRYHGASKHNISSSGCYTLTTTNINNDYQGDDGSTIVSSIDSTVAQHGSLICPKLNYSHWKRNSNAGHSSQKKGDVENFESPPYLNFTWEADNFMEWDCEETDL